MTDATANDARTTPPEHRMQGHWLLAQLGKKVLRPGGVEMTKRLLTQANPGAEDAVVEFGPGVGRTASILLAAEPASYTGVDPNPEGAPQMRRLLASHPRARMVATSAHETGLPDECADLVVGEAMLTMHSPTEKAAIVAEAARLLKPGGRYVIHEMGLTPDDLPEDVKTALAKSVARSVKVGARPLTMREWRALLTDAGLVVEYTTTNAMALLEPKRMLADEGALGMARIMVNLARNKAARERIRAMRATFKEHAEHRNAVGLLAVKPAGAPGTAS